MQNFSSCKSGKIFEIKMQNLKVFAPKLVKKIWLHSKKILAGLALHIQDTAASSDLEKTKWPDSRVIGHLDQRNGGDKSVLSFCFVVGYPQYGGKGIWILDIQ